MSVPFFRSGQGCRRFLRQLRDNVETHAIVLDAMVLMENHFHLLARTPRANLSQFMQRLNTSYALYVRYKHRKPGHQFEARFKAKLVREDRCLLAVTRFIHLNPIKIAACRLTGKSGRAVGIHYGGISASAVGNIRRKVRGGQIDVRPEVEHLQSMIRRANSPKV